MIPLLGLSKRRFAPVILAAMSLILLQGCIPRAVVWTADSNGIVFTEKDGSRLVRYDLTRKARKVVVADTKTKTPWPAISADGKRIAVALHESLTEKDSRINTDRIQIIIYDLQGQELKRSSVRTETSTLEKPATESKCTLVETGLNWSGPAQKILLNDAIYDCELDRWTKLNVEVMPFNNTPISPDGKGFIAATKEKLVFVDWDGWIAEFTGGPSDTLKDFLAFEWKDQVATFICKNDVHAFDVSAMRHTVKPGPFTAIEGDGKLTEVHRFPKGNVQLCVISRELQDASKTTVTRLEAQVPSTKKRRVLLNEGEYSLSGFFFPSPDGSKVGFIARSKAGKESIIVVNDSGSIVATVVPDDE
jgi:hypothetical protein